jgi:hypothetical protein
MRHWFVVWGAAVAACSLAHDADRFSSGDGTDSSGGAAGSGGGAGDDSGSGGAGGSVASGGGAGGSSASGGTGAVGGAGGSAANCGHLGEPCCAANECFEVGGAGGVYGVVCVNSKCEACGTVGGKCCEGAGPAACPGTSQHDACCTFPAASVDCGGLGDPGTGICKNCCFQCNDQGQWLGSYAAPASCGDVAATKCGKPANKIRWLSDQCETLN